MKLQQQQETSLEISFECPPYDRTTFVPTKTNIFLSEFCVHLGLCSYVASNHKTVFDEVSLAYAELN